MKITGKYSIAFFLKLGIDFILLVNILVLLSLPLLLNALYENPELQSARNFYETGLNDFSYNGDSNSSSYSKTINHVLIKNLSLTNNIALSNNLALSKYHTGDLSDISISKSEKLFNGNPRWILFNEIPNESYGFMLGFLYFAGFGTAMILFLIRKVLKNLEKDVILDYSNAKAFKHLSLSCFILVVAFVVKIIFYNTFLTLFCFFLFIILGLFTLVLSEVFLQGAIIKEENELTI